MDVRRMILAAGLVAAMAGCSLATDAPGEPGERAASSSPAGTAPAQQAGGADSSPKKVDPRRGGLELGFGEFAITLEANEIRPGPVTFVVRNGGRLVHGFEIQIEDVDHDNSGPGSSDDDGFKLEGPAFGPGETVRLHAELAPGVYEVECFVAEHDDMGMRAMLVVRQGAPLVRPEPALVADRVEISDFAFAPDQLAVDVGTELTWVNADPTAHTVTARDGSFDSGTVDAGGRFRTTFTEPGTFEYLCQIHPTMRGSVRVG
jgi:plastocyanin